MNSSESEMELLALCHSYIERLYGGLEAKLKLFEKRDSTAFDDFPDAVEGLNWIAAAMNQCESIHGGSVNAAMLNDIIRRLTKAAADEDYKRAGEVVIQEIMPVLCDCYDLLNAHV